MKKLAISALTVLGLSANVLAGGLPEEMPVSPCAASDMGVYVGLSGGLGFTNYKQWDNSGKGAHSDSHFVNRLFIGVDLNRYFATEFGYTTFWGKAKFDSAKLRMMQVFDLFGKIKAPVLENLDVYGKLGVNFSLGNEKRSNNSTYKDENFNLAFGAGIDYAVTPNIIVNAEWLRYDGDARHEHHQPNADAFMLGVRYKFEL